MLLMSTKKRTFFALLVAGAAVSVLAGCSTKGSGEGNQANQLAAADFAKQNGKVTITFDSKGEWESISAIAMAAVSTNSAEGREQAVTIATLRARRNIAEFLSTDINSSRSLVVVSRTLQKANEKGTAESSAQPIALTDEEMAEVDKDVKNGTAQNTRTDDNSFTIANTVRERITSSSAAILKGVAVVAQDTSPDFKTVRVQVRGERRSIGVANSIRMEMMK